MGKWMMAIAVAAILASLVCIAWGETASVLLDKGIYTEETLGDPSSAIGIYSQVIASGEVDRPYAAQAQYRIAMCHLKLKHDAEAREALKTFLSKFSDQEELASKARASLEELLEFDPAALMPPETFVYVEFGSPGKQLETILKMLEGTPLANPLEMISPTSAPSTSAPSTQYGNFSEKGPAQIFAALLNPSMLKEFKKVRSLAVGVTGNNPRWMPIVALLRPGDSDAIRGIVTAAVLAAGQPTAPIEGMQTVQFSPEVACAFDDNVFIFVAPVSQLSWSVHQYKSGAPDPSLLTANESFSRLAPAAARKADALTIWANPSLALKLKELIPADARRSLAVADIFADFGSMEGVVARLCLSENSIKLENTIVYREGHKALGYDLIRTCPLDQAGFAAVPPQAVGVAALALLDRAASTQTPAADARQQALQRITGLDLGRELYSNIEQVTLFLMPPSEAALAHPAGRLSSVVPSLGLAVTSRNPEQTQAVLDKLLSIPGRMVINSASMPAADVQGLRPYVIGNVNQKPIYLYMAQKDKTTVLAFLPEVIQASLTAIETGRNVTTDGPLAKALGQVSDKNKVLLLSAGGALRWYDAGVVQPLLKGSSASQPATDSQAVADQLAAALDNTVLRLETSEQPNTLTLRCEVTGIPPLAQVFPLITQYMNQRQAKVQAAMAAMRAPTQRKMLTPTSIRFASAMARRDQRTLKDLTVPGSPAEAKLAAILERTDLPEFNMIAAKRTGNEGMSLGLSVGTDKPAVALLIRLRTKEGQQNVWRVVDVDILPPAEAQERLTRFATSAPASAQTRAEENLTPPTMLRSVSSQFLSALGRGDRGAIQELTLPGSAAEAKVGEIMSRGDFSKFRVREVRRNMDRGLVVAMDDPAPGVAPAGTLIIQWVMTSPSVWRVTDLDYMPLNQTLPPVEAQARPAQFATSAPASQPTSPGAAAPAD